MRGQSLKDSPNCLSIDLMDLFLMEMNSNFKQINDFLKKLAKILEIIYLLV